MALVETRLPWESQPQELVEISTRFPRPAFLWNHGSASGLDQASGLFPTTDAVATTKATPTGIGLNVTAVGRRYQNKLFDTQSKFAWLIVAYRNTLPSPESFVSVVRKDGSCIPIQEVSDGTVRSAVWVNGSLTIINYSGSGSISNYLGKVCIFGAMVDGLTSTKFVKLGEAPLTEVPAPNYLGVSSASINPFCLGATENGSEIAVNWTIMSVAVWQKNVPDLTQMRDLVNRNPWQVFEDAKIAVPKKPPVRRIFTSTYTPFSQPQEPAAPNDIFTKANVFTMAAPEGFSYIGGTAFESGPGGIGFRGDGSTRYARKNNADILIDRNIGWWMACHFTRSATQLAGRAFYGLGTSAAGNNTFAILRTPASFGTTDGVVIGYRSTPGGSFYETGVGTAGVTVPGGTYCVVAVCPPGATLSTDLYIYLNGVKYNTSTGASHTGSGSILNYASINAAFNTNDGLISQGNSLVYSGGHGEGAIPEYLARDISVNPTLLFGLQQVQVPTRVVLPITIPLLSSAYIYFPTPITARPRVTLTF